MCLGSDSRVTGARDLLDELRAAAALAPVSAFELLRMVTTAPSRIFHLPGAGRLMVGAPADLLIVPALRSLPADSLLAATRRDVALVAIGGRPLVGSPELAGVFAARGTRTVPVLVDGAERLAHARLARALAACAIREPGVECLG